MKPLVWILAVAACLGAAHAQVAGAPAREQAFQALIQQARSAPDFDRQIKLDEYRVRIAAGFPLSPSEQKEMGELALARGNAIESAAVLSPLIASGQYGGPGDPQAERNKAFFARARRDAESDRADALASAKRTAEKRATGAGYVVLGESYLAMGDNGQAIEAIKSGLAKGQMDLGGYALARLQLGIALFRSGDIEAARQTWAAIRASNGAEQYAQAWLMVLGG